MSNLIPRIEFLLQAPFRSQRSCPHCGSGDAAILARKYVTIRVRKCASCNLVFTDPIYRSLLVSSLYDRLYAGEGSTTRIPAASEIAILKETMFRGTDKDFHARLARIRASCSGKRLLEVGSSWGYFLYQAQAAGFQATGVEVSAPRREFGRQALGVDIRADLQQASDGAYDVIYSAHTIEHFGDLSGFFPAMHRLLKPEGWILIEVPNFRFGPGVRESLRGVGAVHPLGLSAEFFSCALPAAGFRVTGFFGSWDEFPDRRGERVLSPTLIVAARS